MGYTRLMLWFVAVFIPLVWAELIGYLPVTDGGAVVMSAGVLAVLATVLAVWRR
jgi:hypothetical protein